MKKIIIAVLALAASFQALPQDNLSALMPMPNSCVAMKGKAFRITPKTRITVATEDLSFAAGQLQRVLQKRMGMKPDFAVAASERKGGITLAVDTGLPMPQSYRLKVNADGVAIVGATRGAVLYGVMTLSQVLLGDVCATKAMLINPVDVIDAPRFERRALMLDPARNFIPVRDVKFYMDQMMRYKYNVLQLHLTDDQGWRMEIDGHPELTAGGRYYTQTELRDLIEYGAERNIEIVPEFDIPGHTVALLAVHPELGCTSNDTIEKVVGKTFDMMVCANVPAVYSFYKDVIGQVAAVFPSRYIHLGGDEAVVDKNWAKCERCQALMKERGYGNAKQLMIPFFEQMLGYVRAAGKQAILWCELDRIYAPANDYLFPYPKDVMLVSWRNGLTPKCVELSAKYGNQLLLAPGEYAYFDYPQLKGDLPEHNNWGMPTTTLQKCYEFDPGSGLPAEEQGNIAGVMGTLWGEAIKDVNRATYMTYPRAFALAEAGWTQMEHRGWESFKMRLYPNLTDLMKSGVSVRVPFEIAKEAN